MNNEQFRSLVKEQQVDSNEQSSKPVRAVLGARRGGHRGASNTGTSFAQSVRVRSAFLQPDKKKTGSKESKSNRLGAGYVDRAKERAKAASEEEDERTKQVADLEQQLKAKQISRSQFEAARDAITAGEITATHLVKGLDRQLLERIRQGEDVLGTASSNIEKDDALDDELDKLETSATALVQKKESIPKQGELAATAVAGRKRTRDDIMAEIKAQRKAAADAYAAAEPQLSDRWATITQKQRTRIEIDRKGREVLVILDENGAVKKKLRRPAPTQSAVKEAIRAPTEVLGADVQIAFKSEPAPAAKEEDSEDDIFEGVGTEYDPLGNDDSTSASDSDADRSRKLKDDARPPHIATQPTTSTTSRNYFNDKPSHQDEPVDDRFGGVQAVIAKAAKLASAREQDGSEEDDPETARRKAKYAAMLDTRDRDLDDMDLGFGASRFEDGEDDGTSKGVRLSEWSADGPKSESKSNKHKKREKRDK